MSFTCVPNCVLSRTRFQQDSRQSAAIPGRCQWHSVSRPAAASAPLWAHPLGPRTLFLSSTTPCRLTTCTLPPDLHSNILHAEQPPVHPNIIALSEREGTRLQAIPAHVGTKNAWTRCMVRCTTGKEGDEGNPQKQNLLQNCVSICRLISMCNGSNCNTSAHTRVSQLWV